MPTLSPEHYSLLASVAFYLLALAAQVSGYTSPKLAGALSVVATMFLAVAASSISVTAAGAVVVTASVALLGCLDWNHPRSWSKRVVNWQPNDPQSFDNKIGFEWRHAPHDLRVPSSGMYYDLTLVPLPVEVIGGGPPSIHTVPGAPIKFGGEGHQCSIVNYGDVPIFNATCVLQTVFWEAVEDLGVMLASTGSRRQKSQGKELIARPWKLTIPRIDPGPASPFVFYMSNPNEVFVRVIAPQTISFQRLGSSSVETARLVQPLNPEMTVSPPMKGLMDGTR